MLKRKSTTVFEGIWKDSKNKELSVSLHEADLSQIKNPFLDSKYIQQLRKEAPEDFIDLLIWFSEKIQYQVIMDIKPIGIPKILENQFYENFGN